MMSPLCSLCTSLVWMHHLPCHPRREREGNRYCMLNPHTPHTYPCIHCLHAFMLHTLPSHTTHHTPCITPTLHILTHHTSSSHTLTLTSSQPQAVSGLPAPSGTTATIKSSDGVKSDTFVSPDLNVSTEEV